MNSTPTANWHICYQPGCDTPTPPVGLGLCTQHEPWYQGDHGYCRLSQELQREQQREAIASIRAQEAELRALAGDIINLARELRIKKRRTVRYDELAELITGRGLPL